MNLKEKQEQPLHWKVTESLNLIQCWYEAFSGDVFVSFSGGKDSTVLLHLVKMIYPDVPGVFVDTGLEYPEIRRFVRETENVTWLRPKMPFHRVVEKYGYPVVSKESARMLRTLQNPTGRNYNTIIKYLTGYNKAGKYYPSWVLAKKWYKFIRAPIKVSEQCCDIMKKNPLKKYSKESKRAGITGMMASDSSGRKGTFLRRGCNWYDTKDPKSHPLAFWTTEDVWEYIKLFNVPYSKIYDMGEDRTGCMFCMFGVHLEDEPNRFQRMEKTHPKIWKYCMERLGLKEILEFIGVPYSSEDE